MTSPEVHRTFIITAQPYSLSGDETGGEGGPGTCGQSISTSTILSAAVSPGFGRWSTTMHAGSGGPPPTRVGRTAMPALAARDCAAPRGRPMRMGATAAGIDGAEESSTGGIDGAIDSSTQGAGVPPSSDGEGLQPITISETATASASLNLTSRAAGLSGSRGESDQSRPSCRR